MPPSYEGLILMSLESDITLSCILDLKNIRNMVFRIKF